MKPLPIDPLLPEIVEALREGPAAVVVAPPGSGKTTRVPPALLDAGLAGAQRILLLQPRRVAARLAAARIAAERGSALGEEIGYAVRFERRAGPRTRIEVLTEGLLTRRLQADPFLEGVGIVLLDELHERSLQTDLALGMLREAREAGREDLKIVALSATLDPGPIAAWLGGCPVLEGEGRAYPVELRYDERAAPPDADPTRRAAAAARRLIAETDGGHVLVFLPGIGEIERALEALQDLEGVDALPLHGRLTAQEQDRALAPSSRRKIVLSTNIAETSVTLEGVRAVVDTGLARRTRFDVGIGLTRLELQPIGRASADQRAGRAGRTGPGICRRLWTEQRHRLLADADPPEVLRAELAGAALQICAWGGSPDDFPWLTEPPRAHLEAARALLTELGAIDAGAERRWRLTTIGAEMASLPTAPRLARLVIEGRNRGLLREAAGIAALLDERDLLLDDPGFSASSDLTHRLELLDVRRPPRGVHRGAWGRARAGRDQLIRHLRRAPGEPSRAEISRVADERAAAELLMTAFPVAQRRAPRSERLLLADGRGGALSPRSLVREAELMVAVGLRAGSRGERSELKVELAHAIDRAWLPTEAGRTLRFDPERRAVAQRSAIRHRALILEERPEPLDAPPDEISAILVEAIAADPTRLLQLRDDDAALLARLGWLRGARPDLDLPDLSDLQRLLPLLCADRQSLKPIASEPQAPRILAALDWRQRRALDALAPEAFTPPRGRPVKIRYAPGEPPVIAIYLQRLLGLRETPRIAGQPAVLELLAPNGRPAQITSDLEGFWRGSYQEVRKALRGRYPRHDWPEDPLA